MGRHHHHHGFETAGSGESHGLWHDIADSVWKRINGNNDDSPFDHEHAPHHRQHWHRRNRHSMPDTEPGESGFPAITIGDPYAPPHEGSSIGPALPSDYPIVPAESPHVKPIDLPTYNGPALPYGSPENYFICQFQNPQWNPNGPPSSADCGPASLATIALAMGKLDPNADRDQLLQETRIAMRGNADILPDGSLNRHNGTGTDDIINGAQNLGLNAHQIDSTVNAVLDALSRGSMCAVSGNPINYERELGFTGDPRNVYANFGNYDGLHLIAIVGFDKTSGKFIANDPASAIGPIELTPEQLQTYMNADPGTIEISPK